MPLFVVRSLRAPALIGLAAMIATLPLLLAGPSCGHDFDFHLLSWLEAANQLAHLGYPHWAYTPAWNAGEPRFLFYPPLSWLLGALLGEVLPRLSPGWTLVPAAFTWIVLTLCGLSMHGLARRFCSPAAALLAATLYLANPYMLFTAYERSAYGELLAAAWLPLLLAGILPETPRILPIALPLALLWLTNAPAAVMGSYVLALLTLIRLWRERPRLKLSLVVLTGTALGFALAAFYIVPAAYEQRFVQVALAVGQGMRPQDHFLFHRMGGQDYDSLFHDSVVRTASWVSMLLLGAIGVAMLAARRRLRTLLPLLILTALIAFLLTPPSLIVWQVLPKLGFLQFPWRLDAMLGLILATTVAVALGMYFGASRQVSTRRESVLFALLSMLLAAALVYPAWQVFHQRCDSEDNVLARVQRFYSTRGTEATDEYTPVEGEDETKPGDPPYWLIPAADPDSNPPADAIAGGAPDHLTLQVPAGELLVLNRRQYPEWHVLVNGAAPPLVHRSDGLITLALPPGAATISLTYHQLPDVPAGLAISGLALLTTLGIRIRYTQSAP